MGTSDASGKGMLLPHSGVALAVWLVLRGLDRARDG
jgi:hypothetical protein